MKELFISVGWNYSNDNTGCSNAIIQSNGIKGYVFDVLEMINHSTKAIPVVAEKIVNAISSLRERKADLIILKNEYCCEIYIKGEYKGVMSVIPSPEYIKTLEEAERRS